MTEAIHEMSRKMMGITAVVDGDGRLLGVISDGDLRRLLEQDPGSSGARPATAAARIRARSRPRSSPRRPSTRCGQHKITSLFICDDDGRLAGALHMHDLLAAGI